MHPKLNRIEAHRLVKQSSDLYLKLNDLLWDSATLGQTDRYHRLKQVHAAAMKRHSRRYYAFRELYPE